MTGASHGCAHIARTNALRIPGLVPDDARVSGTPGLRFRTIADMMAPARHAGNDTANAVGSNGPPGFKSPILRKLVVVPSSATTHPRLPDPGPAVAQIASPERPR